MRTTTVRPLIATALALAAIDASATDVPPLPGPVLFDGRYYEVVVADGIAWENAKAAAEARTHDGIKGQLATIGSFEEDKFLNDLRRQAVYALGVAGKEVWVGGYQTACATTTPEPGCGWLWINGEAIAPTNTSAPYTNWQAGEPNNVHYPPDAAHRADEDHLAIGRHDSIGWNDEGDLTLILGYVVEYGDKIVIPATDCTEAGGCNPTGAQVQQYPESAEVEADATLTARTYRIEDDPSRCGVQPLTLFGGAVVIPPYLCGHPDFLVIETETSGVEILSGAIDVENLTEEVLPGNLYGCDGVRQNPAGVFDPDPSHRDVVGWQTTNPAEMPETSMGTGRFFGTLAEVTYGCGSSRGKVVEGSYHFVGLRIHPGVGKEFADGNQMGNHQSFVELNRYKLELLRTSVVESKYALSKHAYSKLKRLVDAAISAHDDEKYSHALLKIRLFLKTVDKTQYQPIPGENFSGDHIMRGSNIEFMYAKKIIPFAP